MVFHFSLRIITGVVCTETAVKAYIICFLQNELLTPVHSSLTNRPNVVFVIIGISANTHKGVLNHRIMMFQNKDINNRVKDGW